MAEQQKPLVSFRAGKLIKASLWKNMQKGKDGKEYEFKNIQLQKSWYDEEKSTKNNPVYESRDISFSIDEIPKVIAALKHVWNFEMVSKE